MILYDVALVEICGNTFLSLHILTINRVITLPTVSSGYSELYCRNGASRKSDGPERSGERKSQKNDGAERSAEREVAERGTGITEIGWSAERLFRRSRSAHVLYSIIQLYSPYRQPQ